MESPGYEKKMMKKEEDQKILNHQNVKKTPSSFQKKELGEEFRGGKHKPILSEKRGSIQQRP